MKLKHLIAGVAAVLLPLPAKAVDAYWLDQYNALLYISTFRLDAELKEMKQQGAKTLLLHADSLPSPVSRFIAWRAQEAAGMQSIAWIQKPNEDNLEHAAKLVGFQGVQIDDHYFNAPPMSIGKLRSMLGGKQLWCSFQPRQYTHRTARMCNQSDVQLYRYDCPTTKRIASSMGILGHPKVAVATYVDGSKQDHDTAACLKQTLTASNTKLFAFKWKNQEVWLKGLLP
jgi:hypothetical protein